MVYTPRVAILASGSGSTAEAFIRATQDGRANAAVGLVICSKPPEEAGIYERVARLNRQYGLDIETAHINGRTHPEGKAGRGQTDGESAAICKRIAQGSFDHVALMGYMRMVRGELLEEYGYKPHFSTLYHARMSNTHPGPLPETQDTYGIHTSERVLELGLTASKHTVHLVSSGIDKGPVIAEHPVEIFPDDTPQDVFDRVQVVEKAALPYALNRFLQEQAAYLNSRQQVR
ncbi:MAG TPA: formyltransferase family protein [Candidatus Saccharimonadales bacterium]|nr:formyltransferase family protein [Candidatus Saccharimonadales bacterium]